jgi:hypothetical protein
MPQPEPNVLDADGRTGRTTSPSGHMRLPYTWTRRAAVQPYGARVTVALATVGCLLLGGLAVFQALLVAGLPLGRFAWGGQHRVLPTTLRIGSAVSIVLYALFASIIVAAAKRISDGTSAGVVDVGIWVLTAYFIVGIAMNAISRSRPERFVMTPVVLVLAAVSLVLALQS